MIFKKTGFTFVETLIVCSIIAVLAGFVISAIFTAKGKTTNARAVIHMDQIAAAIQSYSVDFGAYPPDNNIATGTANPVSSAASLWYHLGATFHKGANAPINAGPYMDFDDDHLGTGGGLADFAGDGSANDTVKSVIDPWENAYVYDFPAANNTDSYDLSSAGPDGASGNSDDIRNW